jgi:FkbM family methyltransferase
MALVHSRARVLSKARLWAVERLKKYPNFYRSFRSAYFGTITFIASSISAVVDRVKFIAGNPEASHGKFIRDRAIERLYDFRHLSMDSVVIEGGGYLGDWTALVTKKCDPHVIVYEPIPEYFRQIVDRFSSNPKVEVRPVGLAVKSETRQFGIAGNASGMFDASGVSTTLPVADVHEEVSRFKRVDLLELNIEGGEYEVLERLMDTRAMSKIVRLQVQFHSNVPHAARRYRRLRYRLNLTHRLVWRYPFVWEEWRLRQAE